SIGAAPSAAAPNFSAQELDRGAVRLGLRDPQVDRAAHRAGADVELEHALAELRQLAEQQLPAAGGPADPKFLDAEAVDRRSAAQAPVLIGRRPRVLTVRGHFQRLL